MIQKQLYVGKKKLNEFFQVPVKNFSCFSKPIGGFWTSSFDPIIGSSWIQWCIEQEFKLPKDNIWEGYLLTPVQDAKIFIIDSKRDLKILQQKYRVIDNNVPEEFEIFCLDFEKISEDFDALMLTEHGQLETKYELYGWDCESTLWFRWKFENVERIILYFCDSLLKKFETTVLV